MTGRTSEPPVSGGWVEAVPGAEIQEQLPGHVSRAESGPPAEPREQPAPGPPQPHLSPSARSQPSLSQPFSPPPSGRPSSAPPIPTGSRLLAPPQIAAPPHAWNRSLQPLFGDRWPGPSAPPTPAVLGLAASAGLITATAVPTGAPGLGWLLVATALVAAVVVALVLHRRGSPAGEPARLGPLHLPAAAWAVAAIALTAVSALRAATWFADLCLLAAALAAGLAVAGRSFRGVPASLQGVLLAMARSVPWIMRRRRPGGRGSMVRTAVAALVGVALLAVAGPLLAAADPAFAQLVEGVAPAVDVASTTRWITLLGFGAVAVSGAVFLLLAPPAPDGHRPRDTRLRCLDWALPTGLLVALFAVFVAVQFVVLFGGDSYVRSTTGLTYAEYARGGFWQLLAVTVLALGVLTLGSRWAPAATAVEQAWKRGLLASLAGLTLVIVASAINRMWLYQQAYGFTVLRLLVLTCELWLGAGFLIAQLAVLRLRPTRLARPMIAAGLLVLLGLAVLNPERFIAEHNVARLAVTGEVDTAYLATLSADAVPALLELPEPRRSCVLARIADRLAEPDDWRSRNLSRAAARTLLAEPHPTRAIGADCGWDGR